MSYACTIWSHKDKLVTQFVALFPFRGQRQFLQERYPDGKLFVTWFDDGSGHVMYPSGEPAILITVEPAGMYYYTTDPRPAGSRSLVIALLGNWWLQMPAQTF